MHSRTLCQPASRRKERKRIYCNAWYLRHVEDPKITCMMYYLRLCKEEKLIDLIYRFSHFFHHPWIPVEHGRSSVQHYWFPHTPRAMEHARHYPQYMPTLCVLLAWLLVMMMMMIGWTSGAHLEIGFGGREGFHTIYDIDSHKWKMVQACSP